MSGHQEKSEVTSETGGVTEGVTCLFAAMTGAIACRILVSLIFKIRVFFFSIFSPSDLVPHTNQ